MKQNEIIAGAGGITEDELYRLSDALSELAQAFAVACETFSEALCKAFDAMNEAAEIVSVKKETQSKAKKDRPIKPRPAAVNLFLIQAKKCNRLPRSDMTGVSVRQTL